MRGGDLEWILIFTPVLLLLLPLLFVPTHILVVEKQCKEICINDSAVDYEIIDKRSYMAYEKTCKCRYLGNDEWVTKFSRVYWTE